MTRWLTLHRDDLPLFIFTVASIGLATIVVINILNFYRVLMSDFLKVVSEGATSDSTKVRKSADRASSKEEWKINGAKEKIITSAATDNLVEKIRDATFNDGSNGFHPISKDVNKLMNSFFSDEVMEDFEIVGEKEESCEDNISRQRKQTSKKENGDIASSSGCEGLSSSSKKDD